MKTKLLFLLLLMASICLAFTITAAPALRHLQDNKLNSSNSQLRLAVAEMQLLKGTRAVSATVSIANHIIPTITETRLNLSNGPIIHALDVTEPLP